MEIDMKVGLKTREYRIMFKIVNNVFISN